jgi:hypothetical protein
MAMSLSYMSLCMLLAMLVLKFWLYCFSRSQFWHVVVLSAIGAEDRSVRGPVDGRSWL